MWIPHAAKLPSTRLILTSPEQPIPMERFSQNRPGKMIGNALTLECHRELRAGDFDQGVQSGIEHVEDFVDLSFQ